MASADATSSSSGHSALAQDEELLWQRELFRERWAGTAHAFILHFNINDYVFTPSIAQAGRPKHLREYLADLALDRGYGAVVYYARGAGLTWLTPDMEKIVGKSYPVADFSRPRDYGQGSAPQNQVHAPSEAVVALHYLYRLLSYKPKITNEQAESLRIAVIIEDLETIAPVSPQPDSALNLHILKRLFADLQVRRNGHLVIGLVQDLGHIAPQLYAAGSECRSYRVDLPAEDLQPPPGRSPRHDRTRWLHYQLEQLASRQRTNPLTLPGSAGDEQIVAAQTSGFSYDNLADLVRYASRAGIPLSLDLIRQRKRDVIQAQSRDLLEVVEPKYGLDAIAGYEYVKRYLQRIQKIISEQGRNGALAAIVPKGILFLGPPGTGKSFAAACLAQATGFNMVKLKNIRSMWVGETERNLNSVLDLLTAMHPVIVFVDEVDAALGTRELASEGGGSGVERRVFQRLLEFMAMDENRGHVLWIGASNRPDAIDAALISRFDMVIPFLLPNGAARQQMVTGTFSRTIGYSLETEPAALLEEFISRTAGFSGRELDTVCRHALQLACLAPDARVDGNVPTVPLPYLLEALSDFRQARDPLMYELQTLLAIRATNFSNFLPPRAELPAGVRAAPEAPHPLDEAALQAEIDRLLLATQYRRHGGGL